MSWSWWSCGKPFRLVLAGLVLLAGGASDAAPPKPPLRVQVPARAGAAVCRAVLSVKQRLADDTCRLVLSDFSTRLGQPLAEVLAARGQSAAAHVDTLVFKDGTDKRACGSRGILAFTYVGADTVYVCASQFTQAVQHDPSAADVFLIHEVLHTLGLAENPPTSREITARVEERCGDWRERATASR